MSALRRFLTMVRGPRPEPLSPKSIYPTVLKKLELMKKIGPPTEEISMELAQTEEKVKIYERQCKANERKVIGLLRNGFEWRVHTVFVTIASAAVLTRFNSLGAL